MGQKMTPIFDTHAHYDDEAFDEDREEMLGRLKACGIARVVDIGAGIPSSKRAQKVAAWHEGIYCALGVHPSEIRDLEQEGSWEWLWKACAEDPNCVAVGEIGLDYYWEKEDAEGQKYWFGRQLELARELGKPVVIHSREAARDTVQVLKEHRAGEIGGVIHCYSYSRELAREFLEMDFYFGIGGVVTYKNARKLKEAVEYIPLEKIVLETDCPYLSPVPHRGERNSSLNLPYVVTQIAEIKGITEEEVRAAAWENAHALYHLPLS